jgi:hypothetical protein
MSKKVIFKENETEKEIDFSELEDIENIELIDDDDDNNDDGSIKGRIIGITPFVCLIIYFLLGFYKDLWHPGWLVFLLIPIVPIFLSLFSKKKGRVVTFLNLLVILAYLLFGFLYNWWHPGWILFLLIPIISILFGGKHD